MSRHEPRTLTTASSWRLHQLLTHRLVPASHGAEERTRPPKGVLAGCSQSPSPAARTGARTDPRSARASGPSRLPGR